MILMKKILYILAAYMFIQSSLLAQTSVTLSGACFSTTLTLTKQGTQINGKSWFRKTNYSSVVYAGVTYSNTKIDIYWNAPDWVIDIDLSGQPLFGNTNLNGGVVPSTGWTNYDATAIGGCFPTNGALVINAVLPIELMHFDANTEGGKNNLTWATASELNNKAFNIERSFDGKTFTAFGQIKGNNKASTYQYVDNQPFPTTYYRLKQMDFDGTETLSKVVSVQNASSRGSGLKVYPTLVKDQLNVVTETLVDFQIINLFGQQVQSGKQAQQIDVSALATGTYILKVGVEQAKFVKQ
jgi:hypothetical protein